MKRIVVEKDSYYDSVFLMLINKDVKSHPGVSEAVVTMGTEMNRDLLAGMGLSNDQVAASTANDLIIALEGETDEALDVAEATARRLLTQKSASGKGDAYRPATLDAAVRALPEANIAVVSLPGPFAGREVRKALERGLHVMLFSDNVPVETEIALKKLAREKGLLMMGPDCGTAIVNGKPLCFANVVREGDIGCVAASGTGLQEVTCSIHKAGGGISQALGTGGRDLKNEEIGGTMMLMGIEALKNDPKTKVITIFSKPPAGSVAKKVIHALKDSGKPGVVHFIGMEKGVDEGTIHYAGSLEETALMSVALSKGEAYRPQVFSAPDSEIQKIVAAETQNMSEDQRYIRGLFTGGTLADEALILLDDLLGGVYSNNQTKDAWLLADPHTSQEHTIIDLGDDMFTVGRPHPMIDPSTREERIVAETEDPEMAVMMLDMVLGYGSHPDPTGAILGSLKKAKEKAVARGGYLSIIASITGTDGDFQNVESQRRQLESIGCVVMPSNYQASMLAVRIMEKVAQR
ncbi:MAG: acyl-CoA synthetase FdrA [Spirochaetaceae bacterium]